MAEQFPKQTGSDEDYDCGLFNSMNNLWGYPHGQQQLLEKEYALKDDEIERVVKLIRERRDAPRKDEDE